jgi:hypothetical protein
MAVEALSAKPPPRLLLDHFAKITWVVNRRSGHILCYQNRKNLISHRLPVGSFTPN